MKDNIKPKSSPAVNADDMSVDQLHEAIALGYENMKAGKVQEAKTALAALRIAKAERAEGYRGRSPEEVLADMDRMIENKEKTLNKYMAMPHRMEIVEDKDEGGFVVSYPDFPGCITCGETLESALANAEDAKKAWLEATMEDDVLQNASDNI